MIITDIEEYNTMSHRYVVENNTTASEADDKDASEADDKEERIKRLKTLDVHLVVINNYLWIGRVHHGKLHLTRGDMYPGKLVKFPNVPGVLYDFGYIGTFIHEYDSCCKQLARVPTSVGSSPTLPDAVADPAKRTLVPYTARPPHDAVPINGGQLKILQGLQNNFEGIQGPPGTGKSTMIYHIIHSALPEGAVALTTCVQVSRGVSQGLPQTPTKPRRSQSPQTSNHFHRTALSTPLPTSWPRATAQCRFLSTAPRSD